MDKDQGRIVMTGARPKLIGNMKKLAEGERAKARYHTNKAEVYELKARMLENGAQLKLRV